MAGSVEDAARPGGVADGLVNAVFEGDGFFRLGAAHPDGNEDVIRPGQGFAAIGGGFDLGIKAVLLDQFSREGGDQVEGFLGDICQKCGSVAQIGLGDDTGNQEAGEDVDSDAE